MCLSTLTTDKRLLGEAHARGFVNGDSPYERLFSKLFFEGGKLNFKKDLDSGFKNKAGAYLRSFMGSFEPKHEDKMSICALILSELVDLE